MPRIHLRTTASVLALATTALLAACARDDSRVDKPAMVPSAEADLRDIAITTGVKTRLAADSQLSALDIRVETLEGRVLLRGAAPDTDVRRHAADLARTVTGVVEVTNDLSVQVSAR